jgi:hypothetical protein
VADTSDTVGIAGTSETAGTADTDGGLDAGHELQAAAEGVVLPRDENGEVVADKVEFMGERYKIANKVGLMPLIKFAHAASSGLDSSDMEGLAALYAMIRDCIDPGEWLRFERDAIDKRAGDADLLPVVEQTIELLTARPTRRPSGSSDGPRPTSPSSTGSSSSRVTPTGAADLVSVDELLRQAGV